MNKEEIEELKNTVIEDSKVQADHAKEGDALADMGEGEGWRILVKKINKRIAELLEPIKKEDIATVGNLELIGAMAIARSEKIEVLRWLINEVESEKTAKRASLNKPEEPKQEA